MIIQSIKTSIFSQLPECVAIAAAAERIDGSRYAIYARAGSECVMLARTLPVAKALAVIRHLQSEMGLSRDSVHFKGLELLSVAERVNACFLFAKLHTSCLRAEKMLDQKGECLHAGII